MKNYKSVQNVYLLKNNLSNFFKTYKVLLISLTIVLLLGLVTGIFTSSKYSEAISITNIPDSNLVKFLGGDRGSFGLFFTYYIWYSLLILAIIFLNNSLVLNVLNYIYMFVLGYKLGFTISALITLFSFAGIINSILIITPFDLILFFILIIISSIAINRYNTFRRYGCKTSYVNYAKIYLIMYVAFVLVLFVKCLIMPIINITIIVN